MPWAAGAHPPQVPAARCLDDSYDVAVDATRFDWGPWKVPFGRTQEPRWVKTIASAATFGQLDLGSHDWFGTMSRPPYGTRPKIEAPLMAYHFHLTCFERTLKRDAVAAISHGYIAAGDDDARGRRGAVKPTKRKNHIKRMRAREAFTRENMRTHRENERRNAIERQEKRLERWRAAGARKRALEAERASTESET